jgi:hypothetical protein
MEGGAVVTEAATRGDIETETMTATNGDQSDFSTFLKGESQKETERDRQKEIERYGEIQRNAEGYRETEKERQKKTERYRDIHRDTEKCRGIQRDRKRKTERNRVM